MELMGASFVSQPMEMSLGLKQLGERPRDSREAMVELLLGDMDGIDEGGREAVVGLSWMLL